MKKMVLFRRASQAFFFLLFVYALWSTTYPLTGLLQPAILFKIDPFIMLMTAISQRILLPGIIFSIYMIALTLIFGRFFCGWICPLGSAIDLTGALRRKRPGISNKTNAALRKIKFYILGTCFVFALLGRQIAWIFDPLVIAGRFVSMNMIPTLTGAINSFFIILIKDLNARAAVTDFYHHLKPSFLGVKIFYFEHSLIIFLVFLAICLASLFLSRAWCRVLCPLGAVYALFGRLAPLRRSVDKCTKCGKCKSSCRMGAIKDDSSYAQGECILCMDCLYDCPAHVTRFRFGSTPDKKRPGDSPAGGPAGISRRSFLLILMGIFPLLGFRFRKRKGPGTNMSAIRPPAALKEEDFVNRCIRCGNCMKVCITNGLHPAMLQTGIEGMWTPVLVPEIGYCEYHCTLCGRTCPTGAIPVLTEEEKLRTRLGLAMIDRSICLPWAEGKECLVCQEHCPVSGKAIKLNNYGGGPAKPYVEENLCIGCGICQNKCPVRPRRAIRVSPRHAYRT